jgi:hypothetical protein
MKKRTASKELDGLPYPQPIASSKTYNHSDSKHAFKFYSTDLLPTD